MKNILLEGDREILTRDKIVLVLSGGEREESVRHALSSVGWVELRIDMFPEKRRTVLRFPRRTGLRVIGTVRWKKESGNGKPGMSEKERLELYKNIMDCVDYVDVEIKSRIALQVVEYAREKGKKVILSYHDFNRTPSFSVLEKIYEEGREFKPDIVKIAAKACSRNELFTLLSFTYKYSGRFPLVVTPMGVSAVERLMPIYMGSLFTYVSLHKPTAPGQPSLDFIKKFL
jgi:3-dehydroquinate dehydratase-1